MAAFLGGMRLFFARSTVRSAKKRTNAEKVDDLYGANGMANTALSQSPAELVAIARAAHLVGDRELKRSALAELKRRFGMTIHFGKSEAAR